MAVARRKLDQYLRAGASGLVRQTYRPVAQANGDLGLNGSTPPNGVAADAHGSSALPLNEVAGQPNGAGVQLNGAAVPLSGAAVPLNGAAVPLDEVPVPLNGEEQTRSRASLTRPRRFAGGIVRAVLPLAVIASLLWLVLLRPGPWQGGLITAVMVAIAIGTSRRLVAFAHRLLDAPARYFTRRIAILDRLLGLWRGIPAGVRARMGLLVLLNVFVTLALIDTAKLQSGLWAVHTKIAFAVMCGVNILLLKSALTSSLRANPVSSANHFLALEPAKTVTTDLARHNGVTHDYRHSDEAVKEPELASAKLGGVGGPGQDDTLVLTRMGPPGEADPGQDDTLVLTRMGPPGEADPGQDDTLMLTPVGKRAKFHWPHAPRGRGKSGRGKIRAGVAAGATVLAVGWIAYAHPGPLLILAVLAVGAAILSVTEASRHQAVTMLLAVAIGIAAADYMSWRFSVTNWQGWWIAVPLLCAEVLGAIHVVGFQYTVWPRPKPVIEPSEDPAQHAIFILVPTLNEGVVTLRPTLEGCIAARQKYLAQYPHGQVTIVVCNDGRMGNYPRWAEIETLAQELGVHCVTRSTGGGAKAGNIENARKEYGITGSALLAIFDADQVPESDFLVKTVAPFADPKVGWVQTGQYYANVDNPVSRWADDQQSMFYNLLCPGKAATNSAFICGTNVVVRAQALDEIGGLPQNSVTEDFAASINLHPRWRSIYLTDILATGLGPPDIPSYLKQQSRWALGTLGVLRDHWHDILLPKKNGLRFGQRVQYFLACTHYLCGLRDLIYVISPVLFIFTGVPAVRTATLSDYLLHFLPYGVLGIGGMWYSARGVTGLRGVIIGFGSSPALVGSLAAVILHRKKPFAVTSKERQGRRSLRYLGIYVLPLLLCISALAWVTQVKGRQQTSLFISVMWVIYSLLLLASFLWLAYKDIRAHAAAQRSGAAEITAKQAYPSKLLMRKNGLGPALNLGFAALVASPLLLGPRLAALPVFASAAPPFVITQQQVDARYIGVALPVQSLTSQPPVLEHDLGIRFSVIGRTQDISDRFDTAWAEKLAEQGARPWIVLQFGVFGPKQTPPLTASLPGIFNGVDDQQIRRWAVEIRDFGKPVYLTVLLHADRNWSVSSGVTNGGIPEDVPKAWMHIQSVFRAVGADNVAWVWAPADPLHDQQFAPPLSTIDVVLQDFINYPGTRWGDPQQVLQSLAQRYPGKPLFVEVSVSGPGSEKAAWLARLGSAVDDSPQAYALLYHEGGPGLKPTPAQAKSWSEASDPMSLAAWKRVATSLHTTGRLPS
jgi:cellulose synthase/poly-beta-1,6-N-acetylglucosamine synthase-like glycosyltransferase